MLNIDFTFLWVLVNLIILYIVLRAVLFKPDGEYMRKRSEKIAEDMARGEELKRQGEEYREKYLGELDAAAEERRRILDETRQNAAKEYDRIIAEAKKEAGRILENGRTEAEREHERIMKTARRDIASLALAAASKVIEKNMDTETNRELVDKLLEKEGVA